LGKDGNCWRNGNQIADKQKNGGGERAVGWRKKTVAGLTKKRCKLNAGDFGELRGQDARGA